MFPGIAFTIKSNGGRFRHLATQVVILPSASLVAQFPEFNGKSSQVTAIWDTGATNSVISERVATSLGLPILGYTEIQGVTSREQRPVYHVDIQLPNRLQVQGIQVVTSQHLGEFDALIGMDVIMLGDFSVTNANGNSVFSFRFPSSPNHTDFVEQINSYNQKKQLKSKATNQRVKPRRSRKH